MEVRGLGGYDSKEYKATRVWEIKSIIVREHSIKSAKTRLLAYPGYREICTLREPNYSILTSTSITTNRRMSMLNKLPKMRAISVLLMITTL